MDPRTIKMAADGALELIIYGDIGASMFSEGVSAQEIARELSANADAKTIVVRLHSYGGNAMDGVSIYNALARHTAHVEVHVDGVAASAASIVAMAGDRILMAESATLMIHNATGAIRGGAEDARKAAAALDGMNARMADIYARRGNQPAEHFLKLMAEETWLGPQEAIALGLADEVTDAPAMAAHFDPAAYGYHNAPAAFLASATDSKPAPVARDSEVPTVPAGDPYMKILAQAAGLKVDASEAEIVAHVNGLRERAERAAEAEAFASALSAVLKAEGDAAIGVAKAHAESHAKLTETEDEFRAFRESVDNDKHASVIESALAAGKVDKPEAEWLGAQPLATVESFLDTRKGKKKVPVNEAHSMPTDSAKTYAEMTNVERAALRAADPDMFNQLRADAQG